MGDRLSQTQSEKPLRQKGLNNNLPEEVILHVCGSFIDHSVKSQTCLSIGHDLIKDIC